MRNDMKLLWNYLSTHPAYVREKEPSKAHKSTYVLTVGLNSLELTNVYIACFGSVVFASLSANGRQRNQHKHAPSKWLMPVLFFPLDS